ncbi:hypothetical protein [Tepidibacter aestuarii]|uniref:hypothetical protein n=1 Tax=Tepidibacter aestuarii TaxID=2925782 RepID=UPI0020BFB5E9|nr:hypothetical protein [Tepidibacter aestuarii]CAH2213529.1 conserved protein of unknown function [Tepidibacter aestuarii]
MKEVKLGVFIGKDVKKGIYMKKKNLYFIISALVLSNLFTLFRLNNIENLIHNRFEERAIAEDNLKTEINNIYSNVEKMLEKKASILDNYSIKFGTLESTNYTVPVTVDLTPKEYSEELIAKLQLNGKEIDMQKNGTSFTVITDAYIFEPLEIKVILEKNSIEKIETLETRSRLESKYLLGIHGGFSGQSTYGNSKYTYNGKIELYVYNTKNNKPVKVSIVKDINGKIVDEKPINVSDYILIPFNEKIDLGASDNLTVYAKVQDSYGLNYKYIIFIEQIDEKGKHVDDYDIQPMHRDLKEIRDKNNNLLYERKYEID